MDLNEHNKISQIIKYFHKIKFWTEADIKEILYEDILKLARELMVDLKNNNEQERQYCINEFAETYGNGSAFNVNEYLADICPRLWLFVGESVLTFKTYLLFNSNHGHPHMDNWSIIEWNLSQPPATDKFKMIGEKITSIVIHDEINHDIRMPTMKADYDLWLVECGRSNSDYNVPKNVYYPILKIVTPIKIINLGAQWYVCHYPRSLYSIDDTDVNNDIKL